MPWRRGGLKADLQVQGTERLTPLVRQELYQIAQEALNNALKHARAQAVRVLLAFQESGTRLEVSDDGGGFEPQKASQGGGLGLRGMRERTQAIGGTLRVESAPGKGTTIHVTVPTDQTVHR
jgi:signal transduction histidine kinase